MRYSVQVQYVGKNYAGSQYQPDVPTIQNELEKAIRTLINENKRFKTVFSGRTDAGVNSAGQVVHFDLDKNIVASNFVYSLNEILPDDISVSDLKEVSPEFHAQKSAKSRRYRYELINRKHKNAFDGDLLRVKYDVNLERMQESLNYLLGEHDFSSFKSSGTLNPSKVCFIENAVIQKDGDKIIVEITGNRFLYNMVRTIVGTLLEIEGRNLPAEHMKNVLEAKDRRKAGKTVSPYGLALVEVKY
ncbi:MAG: tRNA pseudouridine(38-40) synthase TruA [Heliobacteriaceae bacterium]|jgi:tRNA pseudouridine38-40 synthase|nr:tRNA pseudouridine(38-40) synthase TruA [Heliobacteriaceae bacterium]